MDIIPQPPEKKAKISRRSWFTILAVVIVISSVLGVYGAHISALNNSLSPTSVILGISSINSVLPNSTDWNMPSFPTGNNVASADYTNGNPLPVFGGNVTSPNIMLIVLKNSTSQSADLGYSFLKSQLHNIVLNGIDSGNLSSVTVGNYSYQYFGFYNVTKNTGAVVTVIKDYIVVIVVYNIGINSLVQLVKLQAEKINSVLQYDAGHYVL